MIFVYDFWYVMFLIVSFVKVKFGNGLIMDINWQNLDSDIGGDFFGIIYGIVIIGKIDGVIMVFGVLVFLKIISDYVDFSVCQNGLDLDIVFNLIGLKFEIGIILVNLFVFLIYLEVIFDGCGNVFFGVLIVLGEVVQGSVKCFVIDFGSNGMFVVFGFFCIVENGFFFGDFMIDVENYVVFQVILSKSFLQVIMVIDMVMILFKSLLFDGKIGKVMFNVCDGCVQFGIILLGVIFLF